MTSRVREEKNFTKSSHLADLLRRRQVKIYESEIGTNWCTTRYMSYVVGEDKKVCESKKTDSLTIVVISESVSDTESEVESNVMRSFFVLAISCAKAGSVAEYTLYMSKKNSV